LYQPTRLLQALGIPYSALVSIILGLMFLSFPIGTFVVFNSEIGNEINFEFPLDGIGIFLAGISYEIPIEIEIGDAFVVIWCLFIILFTIAIFGPKKDFLKVLSQTVKYEENFANHNYMASMIKWFVILIVVSGVINFVQEGIGIVTTPPEASNNLIQFFEITLSPISEELGFRVMLIGLPIFAFYSQKSSVKQFFKSLWNPSENLHITKPRKVLILIVLVGIFFGASHVISGESWSIGKFVQATAGGIIIGWVYFKHGLVSSILVHWATNYFIFSYVFLLTTLNETSVQNAFSHSLMQTVEILLLVTGIISIIMLFLNYHISKKQVLKI